MAYKMESGRYRAVRMISGQRRTATFNTKGEARAWEVAQNADEWAKGENPILTAYSAASQYLDDVQSRMCHKVYVMKKSALRLLFKSLDPNIGMEAVRPHHAAAHLETQFRARGGNAANCDRKDLVAWWNWASRRLGLETANPFAKVEKFPEKRKPRLVPREQDMHKLLDNETGETRILLLTLLHTAARSGEAFQMRWDDLDFERRTVRLWTSKRKGGGLEFDLIPMTEELREALMEHKRSARSVFVFCQVDGQPLTHDMHIMDKACKRWGVERFGFHGIRHLSASMLDAAGVSLSMIQAILRHKSANTTAKYLHSLRGARIELGDVFSGKKKANGVQPEGILKTIGT